MTYNSKLINKKAYITDKDSFYFGDYGTIKHFDGECYHIAIFNRNQFLVKRSK